MVIFPSRPVASPTHRLSLALIVGGLLLLGYTGFGIVNNLLNQSREAQRWDQRHSGYIVPGTAAAGFSLHHPALAPGQQAFKMEIPKIHYTAIILEGTDGPVLDSGPGHYIGTAWPGESDNLVVSGHNGFWMSFPGLEKGDRVMFSDEDGHFTYVLDGKKVVGANDRAAIAPTGRPTLSLTTCWPIWAGPFAPQRLIIYGHLEKQ